MTTAEASTTSPPDQDPVEDESVEDRGSSRPTISQYLTNDKTGPPFVLTAAIAVYYIVFGVLTVRQHTRFNTSAFDLGIYDQGLWLISRFRDPFVTVRGLDFFGNHLSLSMYLLAPIYWLGGGVKALFLIQTAGMAIGAVPIWLYGRDRLGNPWWALCPAVAYLLFPALQWMNAWHFHPEKLAIAPMLFAFWFALNQRWRWFAACIILVLLTREDFALTVAVLGLVLALRGHRRQGLATMALALLWFAVATQVLMPWRNDGRSGFYSGYFAKLGSTQTEIIRNTILHPSRTYDTALQDNKLTYYRQMLAPTAGLPLLAPDTLIIAAPQLFTNTMAEGVDAANIRYQYSTMLTAVLFIATIDGIVRLRRRTGLVRFALGALLACSLASNVAWAPSPIGIAPNRSIWSPDESRASIISHALSLIPPTAGVSSSYMYVPHLTHRTTSYLWPNPFDYQNWGFSDEPTGHPDRVEWLMIDRRSLGESRPVFDELTGLNGEFKIVFDQQDVVIARRVKPPRTLGALR